MGVATLIAVSTFRTCGNVPLNRYIFTDEGFLPSETTDQNCEITFDEIDTEGMLVIHFSSGTAVDHPAQAPSEQSLYNLMLPRLVPSLQLASWILLLITLPQTAQLQITSLCC
ncbi:hypothetical protein PR048_030525 [Dryococelus australis]|uniref:CUB domain-containing protein n=1 Tax=Dryococelus australis TaxID=614101 RepID=A0ABQ9G977_9NEOP|nr:hypothetical protein PR048_030525 [Dryococelus australis]